MRQVFILQDFSLAIDSAAITSSRIDSSSSRPPSSCSMLSRARCSLARARQPETLQGSISRSSSCNSFTSCCRRTDASSAFARCALRRDLTSPRSRSFPPRLLDRIRVLTRQLSRTLARPRAILLPNLDICPQPFKLHKQVTDQASPLYDGILSTDVLYLNPARAQPDAVARRNRL